MGAAVCNIRCITTSLASTLRTNSISTPSPKHHLQTSLGCPLFETHWSRDHTALALGFQMPCWLRDLQKAAPPHVGVCIPWVLYLLWPLGHPIKDMTTETEPPSWSISSVAPLMETQPSLPAAWRAGAGWTVCSCVPHSCSPYPSPPSATAGTRPHLPGNAHAPGSSAPADSLCPAGGEESHPL